MTTTKRPFPLKTLLSFLGPGFLVTVGFIDPGNWATNIKGGSKFGSVSRTVKHKISVPLLLIGPKR